jgi:peroxiredoxin
MRFAARLALAMTVSAALAVGVSPSWAGPETGAAAPAFSGADTQGIRHTLGDYAGKTVVLEWTNHECPYVEKHYDAENMQQLQTRAAEMGVVWLTVVSSAPGKQGYVTPEKAGELSEGRGAVPSAVILDTTGEMGRLYEAKTTPHMFVIDGEGILVYQGAIDSIRSTKLSDVAQATNYVQAALDAVEAGTPLAVSETVPYGCSIKY